MIFSLSNGSWSIKMNEPIAIVCYYCNPPRVWSCIPGTIECIDCLPRFCEVPENAKEEIRCICKSCVIKRMEEGKTW
jgi:hypothetical protein